MSKPRTIIEKIWDNRVVAERPDAPSLLYIDLHLVHEVTSPQAFDGLRARGLKVRRPDLTIATTDHSTPTTPRGLPIVDKIAATQVEKLIQNCKDFGIHCYPPLLAILVEQIRDQLRLQRILRPVRVIGQRNDLRHLVPGELDDPFIPLEVRIRTRIHIDLGRLQREIAHPVAGRFGVAAPAQVRRYLLRIGNIAHVHGARSREQHGSIGKRSGRELGIDQPRVLHVIEREDRQTGSETQHQQNEENLAYRV